MLQKLGAHIAACHQRAMDCARRAAETTDARGNAELLSFERSWKHLARSYEFVETLERFLLSAHKSRIEKWNTMIWLGAPKTTGVMKCEACGDAMRLIGIERHPSLEHSDLRTYLCSRCGTAQTEATPVPNDEVTEDQMTKPMDALLQDKAFDAETTHLLGSTFDAAWGAIVSGGPDVHARQASLLRELLAKLIIEMVTQGERNPDRLLENALGRSVLSPPTNAGSLIAPQAGAPRV
jgi:hypothetical protein